MRNWIVVVAIVAMITASLPAEATVFSGRVGLSSYLWERAEPDSTEVRHTQNTGTLNLRLARIAGKDISISTSLRGRYDIRNAGDNADDYRFYTLQFQWRDMFDRADLTAGRQRVYWPTGTVAIDGGQLDIRPFSRVEVSGYYGLTAPDDGTLRLNEHDEGHAFGARVQIRPMNCRLALSFAQLNRARSYQDFEVDNLAYRRLALDWRRKIPGFGTAYGNLSYDMPREHINRAHVSLRWQAASDISVNGQFRYRRPNLYYNSIFWVFGDSRYYEGRLRINYRIDDTWSVNAGGALLDLVDDNATRFDLGVTHRYFHAMLHGKTGYAGATMGVSGQVLYPLNDKWLLRGGTRFSTFELIEDQDESNFEVSSWAGFQWRWIEQSSLDVEAQLLNHDIKTQDDVYLGSDSEFRLLARVSYWFFRRLDG
ncbi:MAG: hypothetical protein GF341_13350 [candidate division Zixibacteria bacterium]|nr:hypothetical protein [candidate division Zixibacteria bacterium]